VEPEVEEEVEELVEEDEVEGVAMLPKLIEALFAFRLRLRELPKS
jgi:hypothetical protein